MSKVKEYEEFIRESAENAMQNQSFEEEASGEEINFVTKHKADLGKAKVSRFLADTAHRKWLSEWASVVVSAWLFAVLFIVINHRPLSDTVLCTLLGTTTANILGLMYIVLQGYFPQKGGTRKSI